MLNVERCKTILMRPPTPAISIAIIALTCFAIYFNALFNGFVYDDISQILRNPWIKDFKYATQILFNNVWAFAGKTTNYYRPLPQIIYMSAYHVFKLKAWGFHLINILFHTSTSIVVFFTVSKLMKDSPLLPLPSNLYPSLIAAMIFATHPIHTEAVTYIAGIADLSYSFFYILSFYLYINSTRLFEYRYVLSLLSFFLATLCKEPALTLPCIIIAYDVARNFSKKEKVLSPYSLARYSLYFAIAGLYLIIRFYALGSFTPAKNDLQITFYEYIINIFSLFSQYLEKMILPIQLNFYYIFHPISSPLAMKAIIALLSVSVFSWFMFREFKKNWVVFIGMLFILIPLLPAFYIPALSHGLKNSFAERYLYLPSFGFALLSALLFTWVQFKKQNQVKALSVIVVSLICLYSIGTISRNAVWKDNYSLWLDTVSKSPDGDIPHGSLGYALIQKGRIDEAIRELQIALSLNADLAEAHNNLGVAYRDKGLIDDAIEEFRAAYLLNPADPLFSRNLKETYEMQRLFNEARTRNKITN